MPNQYYNTSNDDKYLFTYKKSIFIIVTVFIITYLLSLIRKLNALMLK